MTAAFRARLTSDLGALVSRKVTEDQPMPSAILSTTPDKRDTDSKRRRLTSESTGGLVLRGFGDVNSTAALSVTLNSPDPDALVRNQLVKWSQELKRLQPKVWVSDHLVDSGVCIFKCLHHVQWQAGLGVDFPVSQTAVQHDLAACFWIALKHCSIRTAVPNRALMSKATACDAALLGDRELRAVISLDWDINAILRLNGVVE